MREAKNNILLYRMAVFILSFGLLPFFMIAQDSLSKQLYYACINQDVQLAQNLYNSITDDDLKQLPDSSLFRYHYLGAYLNGEITSNDQKTIEHCLKAKAICEQSYGVNRNDYQDILFELGTAYLNTGKFEDALEIFQEGIVKSISFDNMLGTYNYSNLALGVQECYELMGHIDESLPYFYEAWNNYSLKNKEPFSHHNYYPLWCLEQFYYRYEMYDKALEVADEIIDFVSANAGQEHPTLAQELYFKGNILVDSNRHSEAVDIYYRALAILDSNDMGIDKTYGRIASNLLLSIIHTNRWQECDKILKIHKDYCMRASKPELYNETIVAAVISLNKIGTYAKAIELIEMASKLNLSEELKSHIEYQRKNILFNKEITDSLPKLTEHYSALPKESAEWFDVGCKLSNAYYLRKEIDKNYDILIALYDAIKKGASSGADYKYWVLQQLCGLCFEREKYDDALKYATEKWSIVSVFPEARDFDLYYALNELVVAKIRTNHLNNIDVDFEKLDAICKRLYGTESKQYATVLHNRGRAYQLQGRLDDAKQCFTKSISLQISNNGKPKRTVQYLKELEKTLIYDETDF